MSEHTSNTTSGPDGEEWERAVGAAKTLLSSDCGWLELFTRAILEEKGVPIEPGTLYPLLRRLEKQELLTSEWDTTESRPRKFYVLSEKGSRVFTVLKSEWLALTATMDDLLKEGK